MRDLATVSVIVAISSLGENKGPHQYLMATKTPSSDLLWRWEDSLDLPLRDSLQKAIDASWATAQFSAWTYLQDIDSAVEIMEEALVTIHAYARRSLTQPSARKLTARLRSQIRRVAKQRSKRIKEDYKGSAGDLELYLPLQMPDPIEHLLLREIIDRLSPQAQQVASWIQMGYSWREIGNTFGVDHSTVRRAFRKETDQILIQLRVGTRISR